MSRNLLTKAVLGQAPISAPAGIAGALVVGMQASGLNPFDMSGGLVGHVIDELDEALSSQHSSQQPLQMHSQAESDDELMNASINQPLLPELRIEGDIAPNVAPRRSDAQNLSPSLDSTPDLVGTAVAQEISPQSLMYSNAELSFQTDTVQSSPAARASAGASGGGSDVALSSISYDSASIVENDTLVDYGLVILGEGNGDYWVGSDYADTLIGALGFDTFSGGLGDDIYLVTSDLVSIQEDAGAGKDTVTTSISDLAAIRNIEVLKADEQSQSYAMSKDVSPPSAGVAQSFELAGGFDTQTVIGGYGSDYLRSSGESTLLGMGGDDVYLFSGNEVIIEDSFAGQDTVVTYSSIHLSSNVENLIAKSTSDIDLFGNDLDNLIVGNQGDNLIQGGAGNDVLVSMGGEDQLFGGLGADTFILSNNELAYVMDFDANDKLVFALNQPDISMVRTSEFSGAAGEWNFVENLMQIDWNGDATSDSQIFFNNLDDIASDAIFVTSSYVSVI
jgi:Ca2+-binding RTX toxin-like protein